MASNIPEFPIRFFKYSIFSNPIALEILFRN